MIRKPRSTPLVGNALALAGFGLYVLEWVAIVIGGSHHAYLDGTTDADLLHAADGNAGFLAFQAGWFSIVLLGRVLFVLGVRQALVRSKRPSALADFAVAAMTLSVVLETAYYALQAGAAQAHTASETLAVQHGIHVLDQLVPGPLGLAVVALSVAMLLAGAFPTTMAAAGILIGAVEMAAGLLAAPSTEAVAGALTGVAFLMFVWMIWVGVHLLRRRPHTPNTASPAAAPALATA